VLVGGIREVQMPLALQLAVEAVLGAQGIWSTEVSLVRWKAVVNRDVKNAASPLRLAARTIATTHIWTLCILRVVVQSAPEAEGGLSCPLSVDRNQRALH
jgi:hypothetical protein